MYKWPKKRFWFWAGKLQESDIPLVWGIKSSGSAERWSGTVGATSVFGYPWGTLTTVSQIIWPCSTSKRNILTFPQPLSTLPAFYWHKCLCIQAVNLAGQLVQAKKSLFLALCLLFPLTLVSPPGTRGKQNWFFWQLHQLIVSMKWLFQAAWYGQYEGRQTDQCVMLCRN